MDGPSQTRRRPPPILVATVAAWLPMLLWYAAFRPGIMSADSLVIWQQATDGDWTVLHSPLYTAGMWLSAQLLDSPSLLTLGQSLFLAFAIVSVAFAVLRIGANRMFVVVLTAVVVCTPMVGAFSVTLWKDVPFTAAVLMVGARTIDLARARLAGDRAEQLGILRSITAWAVVATLLRQNGVLIAIVLFFLLFLFLGDLRRRIAIGAVVCVVALGATNFVLYPLLGIGDAPPNSEISTMLHDIASVAARDGDALDEGDVALLESVAPLETWTSLWRGFTCASANWQWHPDFGGWAAIDGQQREFVDLWLELARENPRAVAGNRLCAGAVAWRPDHVGLLYTVSHGIDENNFGLRTEPVADSLNDLGRDALEAVDERSVQWFTWRAPGWIYLAYAVVGIAAWRRRMPALLLALVPLVSLQVSVAAISPGQDARYMAPGLFLAVLLLPLATVPRAEPSAPSVEPEPVATQLPDSSSEHAERQPAAVP